ncbi:hypothetical protein ABEF92_008647 [Exophiala dermatitidis]|uniref:Uncharacterized protein n=1 Tax=Exophiala dermatitidis (strain ATCC 34100 / CBS 525.76 / NIH/UT8656) TaxID=858893 RepID=H6C2W0_EXODN|nr:uncharacterized protein HMPREF1120_06836 [Exophiala dermatitidis NIH/UT8656]EHY58834.1 hypothetical protein HMPREF1120_06836 [Exophiala dermatitidis NIH/UT8656]
MNSTLHPAVAYGLHSRSFFTLFCLPPDRSARPPSTSPSASTPHNNNDHGSPDPPMFFARCRNICYPDQIRPLFTASRPVVERRSIHKDRPEMRNSWVNGAS